MAVGRLFEEHGARLYRLGVRFCGKLTKRTTWCRTSFCRRFAAGNSLMGGLRHQRGSTPSRLDGASDAIGAVRGSRHRWRRSLIWHLLSAPDRMVHLTSD